MIEKIKVFLDKHSDLKKQRLSLRLLTWVVICSSFFALLVSAFQLYTDYKRDVASIHSSMQFINDSYLKSLAANAYNLDIQQLELQLQGMLTLQDIEYLEITETTENSNIILARQGNPNSSKDIEREFNLHYFSAPLPIEAVQFATLRVSASLEGIYQRLWDKAIIIIVSNITKTFLASIAIFFIFQFLITRHLISMARFTKQLSIDNLGSPLVLERKPSDITKQDELDQLVNAINNMQEKVVADIEEIRLTKSALEKSEDRFRLVAKLSNDILWEWHIDEGILNWFGNIDEQLGYGENELPRTLDAWKKTIHPEDIEHVEMSLRKSLEENTPWHEEYRAITKDGEIQYWTDRGEIRTEKNGKPLIMSGAITDITERKLAEHELLEAERKSRAWLEKSIVCTKIVDLDLNLQYMSASGVVALNIDDITLHYGKPYPFIFYPESFKTTMTENLKRAIEKNEVIEQEAPVVDVDGQELWFHSTIIPVKDEMNQIEYLMVLSIETTKRKQAENELKQSEERFSLAMQGANDGLWDWDMKTDEVYYSPRWKSMLGYAEDEVEPNLSEWKRLVHKDDMERTLFEVEACKKGNKDKFEVEFRMQHKDGHYIDILSRAFVVKDEKGVTNRLVGTHVDITSRKKADEKISYQASHDALTGLVNRFEFEHRAKLLLSTVTQDENEHALCFMDLDQFKVINDTCGHAAGDEMLRQLSNVLQETVRHHDTLARLGGDEFGVLMEDCSLEHAHRVATAIQKAIQNYHFTWEGRSFKVGVSMGLVAITKTTTNQSELLRDADAACYMAKDKGRNRIHIYHAEDSEIAQRHGEMQWVTRIQHALEEDKFCLYAQSIVSLDNSTNKHYELLIRMIDDKGEIVPPGAFLPAAERYDLMIQVDRWVIEKTFHLLAKNPAFHSQISFISINLSGQSLADQNILDLIINRLSETDIKNEKICFEITETAAISNLGKAINVISTLKALGCRFALDDFGSGLSSFAYLKNLPVDYLKIDGMFVKDIVDDPIDRAMVKSINEIGHVMGMKTIAEFVENDEIKGMLREIGVNYAQGYGIDIPMPLNDLLGRSVNVSKIKDKR
jgi:diguanylate cyclase (GGDEF)-like protein/PAS domain S-box-containing protein